MVADKVHVGDIGTILRMELTQAGRPRDISAATIKQMWFLKPSAAVVKKTAEWDSDGTDGRLTYTFVQGDLDEAGLWSAQAVLVIDGGTIGGRWHSDVYQFKVAENVAAD